MKTVISLILVVSFSVMTIACSGVKVPVRTASDLRNVNPNDQYMRSYRVKFATGAEYVLDDEDIVVQGNTIGLRFNDDEDFRYYTANQIVEIQQNIKRRTGTGALIGAGAGAAVGVLATIPFITCDGKGDPGDCTTFKETFPIVFGIGGALLGAGIGALAGGAYKRKKKKVDVTVSPQVYGSEGFKISGGGLGIRGSF